MFALRVAILLGLTLCAPTPAQAQEGPIVLDPTRVLRSSLVRVEDFHPETDRWTERNNRIRITSWTGAWLFGTSADIQNDVVTGLRLSWEVPGFIGIRVSSGFVGWSRLRVRAQDGGQTFRSTARGIVHGHTISLALFNPELSTIGLAFWAGFGGGLFLYDYEEPGRFTPTTTTDEELDDVSLSGHVFVELDYRVVDVFHIGLGLRQHLLVGDNSGGVTEVALHLSVLF